MISLPEGLMKYWIKDVAKLLGMTTEGVRFFERQGIVTPHRDVENNYRFYDRVQIIDLGQIQKYQKFGFTLKEYEDLLRSTDCSRRLKSRGSQG